ncbi:MBL fold metallo-hydrolase [Xylophilus rhododendri]|uniref:MBL fold metallo-hydrolase n=1 Tax=Xylophilus rhododendri TaxID=2697032 RepID=A0A857JFW7_9BURK|nr:MBL fold metallo-hydrolase [Xylophilus rhododendri]
MHVQTFFDAATSTCSHVIDDGAGSCAIVDPVLGFDLRSGRTDAAPAQAIVDHVRQHSLQVVWLLETHAHADHLSAAPWLQQRLGGRLGIGAGITEVQQRFRGVFNAIDMPVDGSQFDHLFQPGERLAIGRLQATALHVPGHTPADMAYRIHAWDGGADAVFVGDTLFMPDVGTARCDFPGGDAGALFASIRQLLALPAGTELYVCHDYPPPGRAPRCHCTVAEQRAANIHVRDGVAEADFVALRRQRDAGLALPALMLPAVQVNMRGGHLPPPDTNGSTYLRIPIDLF